MISLSDKLDLRPYQQPLKRDTPEQVITWKPEQSKSCISISVCPRNSSSIGTKGATFGGRGKHKKQVVKNPKPANSQVLESLRTLNFKPQTLKPSTKIPRPIHSSPNLQRSCQVSIHWFLEGQIMRQSGGEIPKGASTQQNGHCAKNRVFA